STLAIEPFTVRSQRAASSRAISTSMRSEEHTSELQSRLHRVCRLLLEKKNRPLRRARLALDASHIDGLCIYPPVCPLHIIPSADRRVFLFFHDPATPALYTLSLPLALPI